MLLFVHLIVGGSRFQGEQKFQRKRGTEVSSEKDPQEAACILGGKKKPKPSDFFRPARVRSRKDTVQEP